MLADVPVVVVQYLGVHRAVSFVVCVGLKNENFMETTNQSIHECFLDETTEKILSVHKENSKHKIVPYDENNLYCSEILLNLLYAKRSKQLCRSFLATYLRIMFVNTAIIMH